MDNYGLLFSKSLGGGGGSGTTNYNELSNKPQINSVTLSGNKSLDALGIQAQLTFDTEPTEDSTNPVESGGVYSALSTKQDTLTIDATPTENSSNPVQSGGTYTALAGKQDTLTFDDSPTSGSSNPVKSGGVYSALSDKQDTLTFEGTYNASSNRAATESTVSDAIKALDVAGASGIAASKTISAWSETDGKASISTQDIAIAGTQAVLTGYTPESPSQTDSILATDTVNAAIKKLDERSRVDENNILLLEEMNGAKNLYKFGDLGATAGSGTGVTLTDNGDGTFTATGTASGANYARYLLKQAPIKAGVYIISGISGGALESYRLRVGTGSGDAYIVNLENNYAQFTIATDTTVTVQFVVNSGVTVTNLSIKPMIITKAMYDAGFTDYQPYALSNAELTALADLAVPTIPSTTTLASYAGTLAKGYHTAFIVNGQNPSDSPISDNCFVDFFVYSANTAEMRVYPTYSAYAGEFYVRTKVSGSWGGWFKFQGTAVT